MVDSTQQLVRNPQRATCLIAAYWDNSRWGAGLRCQGIWCEVICVHKPEQTVLSQNKVQICALEATESAFAMDNYIALCRFHAFNEVRSSGGFEETFATFDTFKDAVFPGNLIEIIAVRDGAMHRFDALGDRGFTQFYCVR